MEKAGVPQVLLALERTFYKRLGAALLKRQEEAAHAADLSHKAMKSYADEVLAANPVPDKGAGAGEEESEPEDEGNEEDGVAGAKLKARQNDAGEYDGEAEEAAVLGPPSDAEDGSEGEEEAGEEEEEAGEEKPEKLSKSKVMNPQRVAGVLRGSRLIGAYRYDPKGGKWAECEYKIPIHKGRLDVKAIFESELRGFVVKTIPGITKCFLPKDEHIIRSGLSLPSSQPPQEQNCRTAGVNLQEMFRHGELLDLDRVRTNDIHVMAATYGIEAAARVLVLEVSQAPQNCFHMV